MRSVLILLIVVVAIAIAAGIIVVHRQGLEACVTYYSKDGTKQLNKDCR